MMCSDASSMNHRVTKKTIAAIGKITGETKLKICDVSYVKYQLLKKHDSYELMEMTDDEFKDNVIDVIEGGNS